MDVDHAEEGGDPACWLGLVCDNCGRIREDRTLDRCEHCGAPVDRTAQTDRDRDRIGRARNSRPRDGLGRPLPYGAPGVRRQPEGVSRSPGETLVEAQRLLDDGMPFHAHEVFEDAWKAAAEPERELWRGLAQLAVGLTHAARGNATGGSALLRRGAGAIGPYRDDAPHGIDVAGLIHWADRLAVELDAGRGPADVRAPRLTRS